MSDEELEKIRQKRLEELKQQAARQHQEENMRAQQEAQFEQQKNAILRIILHSDARVRLENLRLAKPQFAEALEMQLIQLYQQGVLQKNFNLPLSDGEFKSILIRSQKKGKRDTKIRIL